VKNIMTTHDESPITRTNPKRMAKGILIMVIVLAFGAAILIPFWNTMIHNAPAASKLNPKEPPEKETGTLTSIGIPPGETQVQAKSAAPSGPAATTPAPAGTTNATAGPPGKPLTILAGASVQGSPNFDPDTITVKKGDKVTVTNKDTVPHTVTSGKGPTDPNNAKEFDTSIIEAGKTADIQTTSLTPGEHPFFCTVHPYMTGKLVVEANANANANANTNANATAASGAAPAQAPAAVNQTAANANANANTNANATAASGAAPAQAPAAVNQTAGPPGKPLTILAGASVQGSPNFDPDTITVKKGDKVTVTNKDTLPHTVTSGKGPSDPNNAKEFDTSIIEAGKTADIQTTSLTPGEHPFFCSVHPYMTGKLVVQ
jgi:plastocyanin